MKQHLDFYMGQFVSEWDEELSELVIISDLCDISENKMIVLKELTQVQEMFMIDINRGERDQEDLINLFDTMKWLVEL